MKGKIIVSILLLYLVASTEFHQVLRLPLLVKHYVEHREQVNDMTFWEFLVMHYETDVPHDDTDMRLPFKTCHHSVSTAMAMPIQKITLNTFFAFTTEERLSFDHDEVHSSYLSKIFQPPRI